MVQLSFFPVGGFPKNGSVSCPPKGADAGCVGDIYESCVLVKECGGVWCPPKQQLNLVDFLYCFEGEYDSHMANASSCAASSGFDVATIEACADSQSESDAAFDAIQDASAAGMANAGCFPWIVIDGQVKSTNPSGGCYGADAGTAPLLADLCAAAKAQGIPLAASC